MVLSCALMIQVSCNLTLFAWLTCIFNADLVLVLISEIIGVIESTMSFNSLDTSSASVTINPVLSESCLWYKYAGKMAR